MLNYYNFRGDSAVIQIYAKYLFEENDYQTPAYTVIAILDSPQYF